MIKREKNIDVLRGISITIMLYAHLLPFYLEKTSLFFVERIICSLSAPVFLFLVGYNFGINKKFNLLIFRSAIVISLAVFIDVCVFEIIPFYSFLKRLLCFSKNCGRKALAFSIYIINLITKSSQRYKMRHCSYT
jgi:uncharacterized membrane protein